MGRKFIDDGKQNLGPIDRMVKDTISYHLHSQIELRNLEFTKLLMLEKNLRDVEGYDVNLLRIYRSKLNSRQLSDYIGARFELNIATTLIRKNVIFETPDPPDFLVNMDGTIVAIECGSAHLPNSKDGNLLYKLSSVINQKAKKPYCAPTTALCVDFTNIHYRSDENGQIDASGSFDLRTRTHVQNTLDQTNFGGVILVSIVHNFESNRLESIYMRCDNKNIAAPLRGLLDHCFPIGSVTSHNFKILQYR